MDAVNSILTSYPFIGKRINAETSLRTLKNLPLEEPLLKSSHLDVPTLSKHLDDRNKDGEVDARDAIVQHLLFQKQFDEEKKRAEASVAERPTKLNSLLLEKVYSVKSAPVSDSHQDYSNNNEHFAQERFSQGNSNSVSNDTTPHVDLTA